MVSILQIDDVKRRHFSVALYLKKRFYVFVCRKRHTQTHTHTGIHMNTPIPKNMRAFKASIGKEVLF